MDTKDHEIAQLRATVLALAELADLLTSQIPQALVNAPYSAKGFAEALTLLGDRHAGLPKLEPEAFPAETRAILEAMGTLSKTLQEPPT